MKIGIVTEYFYPTLGGVTENIHHFSLELLKRGHDFRIITGFRGEPGGIAQDVRERLIFVGRNIPVFFNGSCGRLTVGCNLSRRLDEIFKAQGFDLIHLHSPLFPTLPIIANMRADAPVVATFHTCTSGELLYYRIYRGKAVKHLSRMAGRIAVSGSCARENEKAFGAAGFDIIPNGVDVEWWSRPSEGAARGDEGKVNILFLGRPDKRNGLDTLIAAFAKVHRLRPMAHLTVVGDGPLSFHFRRMVPADARGAVSFEGAAMDARPSFAARADIFCFTPSIASFGVTILEGMSAGRAIIASDIEPFRDLVSHGESALLVKPGDTAALSAAIVKLVDDRALRERLGARAREAAWRYDWKHVAEVQIEYYKEILRG